MRKPGGLSIFFREPVALGFRSFGAPNFDPLHVFFNYFSTGTVAPVSSILVLISSALFESRPAHGERKKDRHRGGRRATGLYRDVQHAVLIKTKQRIKIPSAARTRARKFLVAPVLHARNVRRFLPLRCSYGGEGRKESRI